MAFKARKLSDSIMDSQDSFIMRELEDAEVYESTSAIGTKKLLTACRFFDTNDKYERSEIERRREQ